MERQQQCARSECRESAAAVLTYDHAGQTAFMHEIDEAPIHSAMVLCTKHADVLRVPLGWELIDERRKYEEPVVEAEPVAEEKPVFQVDNHSTDVDDVDETEVWDLYQEQDSAVSLFSAYAS